MYDRNAIIDKTTKVNTSITKVDSSLLEYLHRKLSDEIEIYFKPFLNGDIPDVVLLQKGVGVSIIEIKNWKLNDYFIVDNKWYSRKTNQEIKSPNDQLLSFKNNMFNLHINGLLIEKIKNIKYYGRINTYIFFSDSTEDDINNIFFNASNTIKNEIESRNLEYKDKQISYDEYNNGLNSLNKYLKELSFSRAMCLTKESLFKLKLPKKDNTVIFKNSIYNEFRQILNPNKHSKEAGIEIKYTKNQKKLIDSKVVHEKIKGIAGSGKTTILAKRAVNANLRHQSNVLILSYNITLKKYIENKINNIKEDFHWECFNITNYHNFIQGVFRKLGISIHIPNTIREEAKKYYHLDKHIINNYLEENYYSNLSILDDYSVETFKYKTILIDEIQDYKPEWIKIIRKYFTDNESEIVLYGDEKQNIYERELEKDKTSKTVYGFGKWKSIGQSIRFIKEGSRVSTLTKKFQLAFFESKYEIDKIFKTNDQENLDLGIFTNRIYQDLDLKNYENITDTIIEKVRENKIPTDQVTILCSRIDILREVDYIIRKKFNEKTIQTFESKELYDLKKLDQDIENIRRIKKIAFNPNSDDIKLSTIHSYKGYESDCIFLIIHPGDNEEMIYAGLTRSKYNLMTFTHKNSKYLDFFNVELGGKLKKDNITNSLSILSKCINKQKTVNIIYNQHSRKISYKNIKPYKILFMNDNYYLACETQNFSKFSMFRLSNISDIQCLDESFCYDLDLLDFIENIQTPFSKYSDDYKEKMIKVILEVDQTKSTYFENKKFLSSQEIVSRLENGNLLISFLVTQELEVEDLVKKWLPYLKVIKPLSLDEKIKIDIKKYLN